MDRIRDDIIELKEGAQRELIEDNYGRKVRKIDEEMDALRAARQKAEIEKRDLELILKLGEKGSKQAWEQLSEERKFEKKILLAVFWSEDIPTALNIKNWDTNAPEDLKHDREIWIARAATFPQSTCSLPCFSIPDPLLGDLAVLCAVVKPCPLALLQPGIPTYVFDIDLVFQAFVNPNRSRIIYRSNMEKVLERFSGRIRSNAEYMIMVATKFRLNIFPHVFGDLRNNKEFYLKLGELPPEEPYCRYDDNVFHDDALKYCSDAFKADREVVLAFVQQNGVTLKDADISCRQDLDIVCAAAEGRAEALLFSTGLVRKRLSRDKNFMKRIFNSMRGWNPKCQRLYAMMDTHLKLDLEMIVAAHRNHCIDVSDLPDELSEDPNFWKAALGMSYEFWRDLPEAFKRDISFARCITGFECWPPVAECFGDDIARDVMDKNPELKRDVEFWRNSILNITTENGICNDGLSDLVKCADPLIRCNRELMLLACSKGCDVLRVLPRDFMLDREFVEAHLKSFYEYCLVEFIPFEVQMMYPDLVALAISKSKVRELERMSVNPELWSNVAVAEAWFRIGGRLHDGFRVYESEDVDFCLLLVKFCSHHEALWDYVSPGLRADKDFMLRAIRKNALAYANLAVGGELERDYEVTLAGFGHTDSERLVIYFFLSDDPVLEYFFHSFLPEVERKLQLHESFCSLVRGLSSSGSGCRLSKLQQGDETSIVWKRLIADFLGNPTGDELAQLRRAAVALRELALVCPWYEY